jgi:hypothetical protein
MAPQSHATCRQWRYGRDHMQRGLAGAEARAELTPLLTTACPRGSTARRSAWLDRYREGAAAYRGRVRRSQAVWPAAPLARPAWDCPLPARNASGRFPGGAGRSAEMADRLSGFANLRPLYVAS